MYDILELSKKLLPELRDIAKELKIKKAESLKKQDLIYKILDHQAIEATEDKTISKTENEDIPSESDNNSLDNDSSFRRGKRPRTLKPVVKRKIESVMSVSPDDLIRQTAKPVERPEQVKEKVKKPERTDEKPDLFKDTESAPEKSNVPK